MFFSSLAAHAFMLYLLLALRLLVLIPEALITKGIAGLITA